MGKTRVLLAGNVECFASRTRRGGEVARHDKRADGIGGVWQPGLSPTARNPVIKVRGLMIDLTRGVIRLRTCRFFALVAYVDSAAKRGTENSTIRRRPCSRSKGIGQD